MFKKVKATRAFACLLVLFSLLTVWAFAEEATAPVTDEVAVVETVETAEVAETETTGDPEVSFMDGIKAIAASTGFANGVKEDYIMIVVACVFLYSDC